MAQGMGNDKRVNGGWNDGVGIGACGGGGELVSNSAQ